MNCKKSPTNLSWHSTTLIALLSVTSTLALGQGVTSQPTAKLSQHPYELAKESQVSHPSSLLGSLKSPTLEEPYRPITAGQTLGWFTTSTIGPPHLAAGAFLSACGTVVNRPPEYRPHWDGFANRFAMGMAGSATSNAMEAGVGLILREDPRYFRVPRQAFKSRVANAAILTFLARNESGKSGPAFSRYLGIVGGNFLSNFWSVHSQANAPAAFVRASEGFAGRMAANAFQEFWPDVKRYVFRKHNRLADGTRHE